MNKRRIFLIGISFLFSAVLNAANYQAGTKEGSPNMNSGDSDTGKPQSYTPIQGLGAGSPKNPPKTPVNQNKPLNQNVDMQLQIINSKNEFVPVFLWVTPTHADGRIKSVGTRKGAAPKGKQYFKNVQIGQSFIVLIRPRNGKVQKQYVTISKGDKLKQVGGRWVYMATFIID